MTVIPPDAGTRYDSMGDSMRFVLTAAASDGQYTLIEDTLKPGFHIDLHLHRTHAESFYVLEGEITFTVGAATVRATPGTTVYVAPGVPHAASAEAPAKMLTIFSPGGLEGAMAAFARLSPEELSSPEAAQAIMQRYDIVDLAEPPMPGLLALYDALLAGDAAAVLALFAAEPALDTPLSGPVRGEAALRAFVAEQQGWLAARQARPQVVNALADAGRLVVELVLHLSQDGEAIALPVAVVADRAGEGLGAIRVYHSTWPLTGAHVVRAPLLAVPVPAPAEPPLIAAYMAALEGADMAAMLGLFTPDGYVREPSGAAFRHAGPDGRAAFYRMVLQSGGVRLRHCTATFDGQCFAVEYICDRWGATDLPPQAGVAVYHLASPTQLHAVRIYDDVSPPME